MKSPDEMLDDCMEKLTRYSFTEDELTMLLAAVAVAQGDDEWPGNDDDLEALRSAERKLSASLQRWFATRSLDGTQPNTPRHRRSYGRPMGLK